MASALRQWVMDWCAACSHQRPTREDYLDAAREFSRQREQGGLDGLWRNPPLMVTATIDDGWGHGLQVVEALARAVGVEVHSLGVLQGSEAIVAACRRLRPRLLGLTVLQLDSDETVREIARGIPSETLLIAGGAAYLYDPDFAERTGTALVIPNGREFLRFLLTLAE